MGCCAKKKDGTPTAMSEFLSTGDDNPLGIKLSFHDFEKLKVLGKGSFGEVLLVQYKANGKYYAMKVLLKSQVKMKHQELHTKSERDLMVKVNCPFIVSIKFAFQDNLRLYIITEFMQGGEMFFHLHKEKRFSEEKTRFYIIELIMAITFLHNNKMLYRDLKPENIMVGADGHIKLTDFGLSKIFQKTKEKAFTICGTPQYLAPEILTDDGYDSSVDWWSLGCVMYEMLVGKVPFRIPRDGNLSYDLYTKKVTYPDYISDEAKDLISKLLVVEPKKRLGYGWDGANKIKEHPFFEGIDWKEAWEKKIEPPFVPELHGIMDLSYFDKIFTDEKVEQSIVSNISPSIKNADYKGFTYVTKSLSNELIDVQDKGDV